MDDQGRDAQGQAIVERVQARYSIPELDSVVTLLFYRWAELLGGYGSLPGKRLLDLGCGSHGEQWHGSDEREYEPWLCRLLHEAGAYPVGIDAGPLDGEPFEHHGADLRVPGALGFLPSGSFDSVHSFRLLALQDDEQRSAMEAEFRRQANRLLREGGIFLSDSFAYGRGPLRHCRKKGGALRDISYETLRASLRRPGSGPRSSPP